MTARLAPHKDIGFQSGGYIHSISSPPQSIPQRRPSPSLPKPRNPPLHVGSRNTAALKDHLDATLMKASRTFHRRFQSDDGEEFDPESAEGQRILKEGLQKVLKMLEQVLDLVWISGLPAIQVPYLLRLTDELNDYLAGYPADLEPTVHLLDKLDIAFHTLLSLSNPTVSGPPVMSQTDRVRLKSIAERVRLHAVELAERWEDTGTAEGDDEIEWEVEAAGVFRRTLGVVGTKLEDLERDVEMAADEVPEVGMSWPPDTTCQKG